MAIDMQITEAVVAGGKSLTKSSTYTGDARLSREVEVATAETDYLIAMVLDVSEIDGIYIVSDQTVTFETNNGAAPAETISLVADVPYLWTTSSYFTNLLATDITAIYITNASGSTATINIEVVFDSTV